MSSAQLYDTIGATYTVTRRTEPRIAAQVWAALGGARTVVNVGAGTGSYEPPDRDVTAVEPEGRTHELFGLASATVNVRGVEEGDALLDALVDNGLCLVCIEAAAEVVAAEADDGDLQARPAEASILHCGGFLLSRRKAL